MCKVAIVTGGTSGIGRATALALQSDGWTVYELSRRGEGMADVRHIVADITKEETLSAAVAQVMAEEGRIDLVINNAGFGISGAIEFTTTEEARRLFDANFFGMVRMNRCVIPLMRAQGSGRIINLSSVAAPVPIPFQAYYSATKAAVNDYTMALANELRPFGVSVCAVQPGDIKTGFTAARERWWPVMTCIRAASAGRCSAWSTTNRPAWIPPGRDASSPMWPPRAVSSRFTPSAPATSSLCFWCVFCPIAC